MKVVTDQHNSVGTGQLVIGIHQNQTDPVTQYINMGQIERVVRL